MAKNKKVKRRSINKRTTRKSSKTASRRRSVSRTANTHGSRRRASYRKLQKYSRFTKSARRKGSKSPAVQKFVKIFFVTGGVGIIIGIIVLFSRG